MSDAADRKLNELNNAPYTPEQLEELRTVWCNTNTLKVPHGELILRLLAITTNLWDVLRQHTLTISQLTDALAAAEESDATESTDGYLCDP